MSLFPVIMSICNIYYKEKIKFIGINKIFFITLINKYNICSSSLNLTQNKNKNATYVLVLILSKFAKEILPIHLLLDVTVVRPFLRLMLHPEIKFSSGLKRIIRWTELASGLNMKQVKIGSTPSHWIFVKKDFMSKSCHQNIENSSKLKKYEYFHLNTF